MKSTKSFAFWMAALLLVACLVFVWIGFDKISNYYYSEHVDDLNKNAYVGGDAYNLIINGTYFSGYMSIGAGCLVGSIIMFCFGSYLKSKETVIIEKAKIIENNESEDSVEVSADTTETRI